VQLSHKSRALYLQNNICFSCSSDHFHRELFLMVNR